MYAVKVFCMFLFPNFLEHSSNVPFDSAVLLSPRLVWELCVCKSTRYDSEIKICSGYQHMVAAFLCVFLSDCTVWIIWKAGNCVCVRACERACIHVCVHVCVRTMLARLFRVTFQTVWVLSSFLYRTSFLDQSLCLAGGHSQTKLHGIFWTKSNYVCVCVFVFFLFLWIYKTRV